MMQVFRKFALAPVPVYPYTAVWHADGHPLQRLYSAIPLGHYALIVTDGFVNTCVRQERLPHRGLACELMGPALAGGILVIFSPTEVSDVAQALGVDEAVIAAAVARADQRGYL